MSEKSENYSPRNNPLEFAYYVTQQTLTFENHFGKATFENESYPLEIYDHFSRITGALISSNKNVATFNIKKKDIPLPDSQYYYDRIHAPNSRVNISYC